MSLKQANPPFPHGGEEMADKINLLQFLLKRGRHFHDLGLNQQATKIFQRLATLPFLSAEAAEEIQHRLAEIRFDQGKYRRARRHLAAALSYQPTNPHYHYMMALATDADPQSEPRRAMAYLKQAVQLDPDHPIYQCEYGLKALSLGRRQAGLRALKKAEQLSPDDPEILDKVSQGLIEEGAWDEARRLLRSAMFRNPRSQAIRSLWQQRQFDFLQAHQQAAREEPESPQQLKELVLLPFRRLPPTFTAGKKILRHDRPAASLKPKRSLRAAHRKAGTSE